ncbi:hypothetical protein L6452_35729 [Arctium lappa]|uniref:Uncharacterized protein n=1 Tax=Arctium lappa TaxID=4217 RepID=A0ACB8Y8D1_ARCLA|nr:hypothetical protein L6452_35729 [Arctium lappa]
MVRVELKSLFKLIKAIASFEGLKGFWKGNFVNILRTAPFKALNLCAYLPFLQKVFSLGVLESMKVEDTVFRVKGSMSSKLNSSGS